MESEELQYFLRNQYFQNMAYQPTFVVPTIFYYMQPIAYHRTVQDSAAFAQDPSYTLPLRNHGTFQNDQNLPGAFYEDLSNTENAANDRTGQGTQNLPKKELPLPMQPISNHRPDCPVGEFRSYDGSCKSKTENRPSFFKPRQRG